MRYELPIEVLNTVYITSMELPMAVIPHCGIAC